MGYFTKITFPIVAGTCIDTFSTESRCLKHEAADAKFAINCFVTCQYSRLSYPQQDLLTSVGVFIFSILRSTKYFRRRNITQYNTNNIGPMLEEFLMLRQYYFSFFFGFCTSVSKPKRSSGNWDWVCYKGYSQFEISRIFGWHLKHLISLKLTIDNKK